MRKKFQNSKRESKKYKQTFLIGGMGKINDFRYSRIQSLSSKLPKFQWDL